MQDLPFYWLALWWQTLKDFCKKVWIAVDFFELLLDFWQKHLKHGFESWKAWWKTRLEMQRSNNGNGAALLSEMVG